MQRVLTLTESTVGKKALMAISGAVLLGFVFFHMLGNLQVFAGAEKYNAYAEFLKTHPQILWPGRIVVALAVFVHAWAAFALTALNANARPESYRMRRNQKTTYAALTMKWGGPLLLAFILFHLAHFTWGAIHPGYDHSATDVYSNFIASFQVPWLVGLYVVAQIFLILHLFHGAEAALQSLGLNHPKYNRLRPMFSSAFAAAVGIGNLAMPLAVFFHYIG